MTESLVLSTAAAIMRRFSVALGIRTVVKRKIASFTPHAAFAALAALSACSSVPMVKDGAPASVVLDKQIVREATPRNEPLSAYGNPTHYSVFGKRYRVMSIEQSDDFLETGMASWYGTKFHGGLTSTREPYDMYAMTAAHKTLPLPSYVQVTNLENGRVAIVRVNDRGPFHDGRVIDLSYAAASRLGVVNAGIARVEVKLIAGPIASKATDNVYVQAGAFTDQDNAARLVSRLETEDIEGDIRTREIVRRNKTIFRVHVGPFPSRAAAHDVAQHLLRMGLTESMIVTE